MKTFHSRAVFQSLLIQSNQKSPKGGCLLTSSSIIMMLKPAHQGLANSILCCVLKNLSSTSALNLKQKSHLTEGNYLIGCWVLSVKGHLYFSIFRVYGTAAAHQAVKCEFKASLVNTTGHQNQPFLMTSSAPMLY